MEPTDVQRRTLECFADAVSSLATDGRVEFVALLRERFCLECGEGYSGYRHLRTEGGLRYESVCYCTRDD